MSSNYRPRNKVMEEALKALGFEKKSQTPESTPSTPSTRRKARKPSKNVTRKKPSSNNRKRVKIRDAIPDNFPTVNPWAEARKRADEISVQNTQPEFIEIHEESRVNPALCMATDRKRIRTDICGTHKEQLYDKTDPNMYPELVLGLDFGTANTKVVIMEQGSQNGWAVEFTTDANPFLMPSCVYKKDDIYTLINQGERISDLKLPLLLDEAMDSGHINHILAFLALIIRYSRDWFFKNYGDVFPNAEFEWNYHIGLPASNFRDKRLVTRFRTLIAAAADLSLNESERMTEGSVAQSLISAHKAISTNDGSYLKCDPHFTKVFPEIAAQLHGYVKSDRWDRNRPKFMLVDVGGGTVDSCILNVTETDEGELRYSFLKSSVQKRGVVMLHLARLQWIEESLLQSPPCKNDILEDLSKTSFALDNTQPLPESVSDYLIGADCPDGHQNADRQFYSQYGQALWNDVIAPVKTVIDPSLEQWKSLPFILCGGGSQHAIYRKFSEVINRGNSGSSLRLSPIQLSKPENLKCPGCPPEEYHRLSVAYGLAHWELGEIVVEDDIEIDPRRARDRPTMVGAEQM